MKKTVDLINSAKLNLIDLHNIMEEIKSSDIMAAEKKNDELQAQIDILTDVIDKQNEQIAVLSVPAGYYKSLIDIMNGNEFLQKEWINFMALVKLTGEQDEVELLSQAKPRKRKKK